jgi:hypothetical protein
LLGKWLIILTIFGLPAGIELPGIIKKKHWKEFAVYSGFLIIGFTVTVMDHVFKFNFAAITDWFITFFSKIGAKLWM